MRERAGGGQRGRGKKVMELTSTEQSVTRNLSCKKASEISRDHGGRKEMEVVCLRLKEWKKKRKDEEGRSR